MDWELRKTWAQLVRQHRMQDSFAVRRITDRFEEMWWIGDAWLFGMDYPGLDDYKGCTAQSSTSFSCGVSHSIHKAIDTVLEPESDTTVKFTSTGFQVIQESGIGRNCDWGELIGGQECTMMWEGQDTGLSEADWAYYEHPELSFFVCILEVTGATFRGDLNQVAQSHACSSLLRRTFE